MSAERKAAGQTHARSFGTAHAVIGVPDATLGEEVHAIVAVKARQSVTAAELIEFVKQRVAAYKCPRTVEFRDHPPQSATGKILKTDLRPS